jgi:signal transduction histidine kinase
LELLQESRLEPEAMEAATRGIDEIDRASSLVQTILTVRAGEHGALKLHLEETSVRELLGSIVGVYATSAEDKGLTLSFDSGEDITLSLDQQRLTQAAANLLDNAIAYTPAGGAVIVRLEVAASTCTIRVLDSGPGIQPEEVLTIWQRFIRGSAASARTPGMGLGLSLVRAVARAHGGDAGGGNRVGGGAEMWVVVPRK